METFDFPYHLISEEFPDSSDKVKFGRGWEFASAPRGPDQLIFTLTFPTMVLYETTRGSKTLDITKNPKVNMGKLIDMYQRVRCYTKFIYPHPWRGNLTVRFDSPLVVPKGLPNGGGHLEGFEIKLRLQP